MAGEVLQLDELGLDDYRASQLNLDWIRIFLNWILFGLCYLDLDVNPIPRLPATCSETSSSGSRAPTSSAVPGWCARRGGDARWTSPRSGATSTSAPNPMLTMTATDKSLRRVPPSTVAPACASPSAAPPTYCAFLAYLSD
ncbi:hypothetical protein EJB05_09758, partial [Eragrostis curvula]